MKIKPRLSLFHRLAIHNFCQQIVVAAGLGRHDVATLVLAEHYQQQQKKLLRTDPADNISAARQPRLTTMRRAVAVALVEKYTTTKGQYESTYLREAIFEIDQK